MRGKFIFMVFSLFLVLQLYSQDTTSKNLSVGADLVSHYVWRGLLYSPSPNIQPSLTYTSNSGNFNIGAWGSYSLSNFYSEVDLYADYTIGPITFAIWDYFAVQDIPENKYFYYGDSTMHAIEGSIIFSGSESLPIQLTLGTFLYGYDKDAQGDKYYSTYIEAAYPIIWGANEIDLALGVTTHEGLYGSKFALCNVSLSHSRKIVINDKISFPISGALIMNPHLENIYLVFSINISSND